MKLLVLAQIPPPVHGQSVMVQALVKGLPERGIPLHHVNLRLSHDAADIGRWRPAKIFATLGCALRAIAARFRHGCDTLYYVPAPPAKRGALYRDWLVMALCRPFFRKLVLHWHAAGLGEWLEAKATRLERAITGVLLGRADLALVLAHTLRHDAERLRARQVAVVPNGIRDPGDALPIKPNGPFNVIFLGLCSEEKGLFAAAHAVVEANQASQRAGDAPAFVLTAAGPFDGESSTARWRDAAEKHPHLLRHIGVVDDVAKRALLANAHALCLPTRYPAEALPLVAIEALAADRPVVATRWRGLPEIVTAEVGILVPPGDESALTEALLEIQRRRPPPGVCRARFLANYTYEQHLKKLCDALHAALT